MKNNRKLTNERLTKNHKWKNRTKLVIEQMFRDHKKLRNEENLKTIPSCMSETSYRRKLLSLILNVQTGG